MHLIKTIAGGGQTATGRLGLGAFEQGTLKILDDAQLIAELVAFDFERLPSGLLRYGAPRGMNDDCVMSLALAYDAAKSSGPLLLW